MKVTCFDGGEEERRKVKKIKGAFYRISSDTLTINGVVHRCTHPRVIRLDDGSLMDLGEPTIKMSTISIGAEAHTVKGDTLLALRAIDDPSSTPIALVSSAYNDFRPMYVTEAEANKMLASKSAIAQKEGVLYMTAGSDQDIRRASEQANKIKGMMYDNLRYTMAENMRMFKRFEFKPDINLGLDKYVGGLTFGAEFETSSGFVPHNKLLKLGVAPLRDGSISGYEYTTVPMSSINHLYAITNELSKTCRVTHRDAFHIHIGNVPRTNEFVLKMWEVVQNVQDEMYTLVPGYKLKDKYGIKRRGDNYTNPLPTIDFRNTAQAEANIARFLSDGQTEVLDVTPRKHPSDRSGSSKWNIRSRYTLVNFINLVYNKTGTVEFRLHQGTINQYKVIYWLLINVALVRAAMAGRTDLKTLDAVINHANFGTDVQRALLSYVETQKTYFANYKVGDDVEYRRESNEDAMYSPEYCLW